MPPQLDEQSDPQPQYARFIDNPVNLSDNGLPLSDFGYAVKIVREQVYTLSKSDFMIQRWKPQQKDEFPVSYHKKTGKVRPPCINSHHRTIQPF